MGVQLNFKRKIAAAIVDAVINITEDCSYYGTVFGSPCRIREQAERTSAGVIKKKKHLHKLIVGFLEEIKDK